MWVFLKDAYVSIVAPSASDALGRDDVLVVRARAKGDIERIFPNAKVEKSSMDRDYAFRAFVPRILVMNEMAAQVRGITATNFKDSVTEPDRLTVYQRVWSVMLDFQTDRGNPGKYGRPLAEDLIGDPAFEDYLRPGSRSSRRARK